MLAAAEDLLEEAPDAVVGACASAAANDQSRHRQDHPGLAKMPRRLVHHDPRPADQPAAPL